VSHHLEDEDLLTWIEDTSNEPILVPPNVEDDTVADKVSVTINGPHVSPILPRHTLVVEMSVPCSEWLFRILAIGTPPKLLQPGF